MTGCPPLALKGQKLLAQGSTLGKIRTQTSRPARAKALKYQVIYKAFAPTGRPFVLVLKPWEGTEKVPSRVMLV